MPTFTQTVLLGTERLNAAPAPPHATLGAAWDQLDWAGEKETALLEASALTGTARGAGALTGGPLPRPEVASADAQKCASPRATALLRQLFAEELRPLLPEWIELCARSGARIPPFFLPTLYEIVSDPGEREQLRRTVGERGRWLARQNPAWAWVVAAAPSPDASLWETGTEDERLATLRDLRASEPARAIGLLDQTWAEDTPEFRLAALALLRPALSLADEPLLTRALGDRRKEVRGAAQALLATLPASGFATRMRTRAEQLLTLQRGLLGKKFEVTLPSAFDAAWKTDAIEEKAPTGIGEKAHWAQQILALVPVAHWTEKFGLDAAALVALGAKSGDWGDLLLGAWFRAACLHRDAAASAALIRPIQTHPKALPPGTNPPAATGALLEACNEAERWRIVAAEADLAWTALPLLTGTPGAAEGRTLFEHLRPALQNGFNPGGSPAAVLAARRIPPELRDEAARRLERENGLSKPAEAFLRALELRAELHAAFSNSTSLPRRS